MRKVFYVFAVGLMLLTACGKKTAANDQESKESEEQTSSVGVTGDTGLTSNIGLASNLDGMPAMTQMEAIYADARKNWKQWNQQDWVQFSKKQVQAIIDIYEKDGSADELNMLEEIQHRLFNTWAKEDEDFNRMLAGAKEFESNAEMWINADPWSGGEAFLNDKECEALLAKYEKLAEKWNKRHQGGAKVVTVETIEEEEEDSVI